MSGKKGRKTNSFASHTFRDEERVGFNAYPEELPVYVSHTTYPAAANVYSAMDLPLGMVVRPFITNAQQFNYKGSTAISKAVKEIGRCEHCGAYINAFCDVNPGRWFCSLCGKRNHYSRNQLRYKHIDPRLLPELRDLLMDYIAPVKEDSTAIHYSVPVDKRPLIHIFLIQEDMDVDTMQTTIDAINAATATIHPDIYVMLITFSYRIGIYSLHSDNPHAGVQYLHFVDEESGNCLESVVEEHGGEANIDVSPYSVQPPLTEYQKFSDAACPVGECRDSLGACLSSILDGIPTNSNSDSNRKYQTLFKTLESLQSWIRGAPSIKGNKSNSNLANTSTEEVGLNAFDFSKLWSLLGSAEQTSEMGKKHQVRNVDESRIAENEYTGILLHIFLDRSQHNDQSPSSKDMDQLIFNFCQLNINVNIWGVCSFESHEIGAYYWNELLTKTGGMFVRHTLGVNQTKEEQLHLTQQLTRKLTTPYATKCQMKIRTSPALLVQEEGRSGLFQDKTGEVFEIPAVSPDTSYAFPFGFDANHTAMLSTDPNNAYHRDGSNIEALGMQIVFSYETIQEAQEVEETTNDSTATGNTSSHHYHPNNEREFNTRIEEYDQSRYLKDILDMLGMDMLRTNLSTSRDAFDASPSISGKSSKAGTPASSKMQFIASVKRLFDSRIASTMVSPSSSGKNYGSSYTKLRTLSPYNFNKALVVTRHVRAITLAVECSRDVRHVQQAADDSVCTALMLREAIMANRLNHKLHASEGGVVSQQNTNSQAINPVRDISSFIQDGLHGEAILVNWITRIVWMHVDSCTETNHLDGSTTLSLEMKNRYEDIVKVIFQQSQVQHVLQCLYTGLMKLIDGKRSDHIVEWMHMMLAFGPFLTYRLLYPALQGITWQANDFGGIQSIFRSEVLPLRRDALVTVNMPYYILDAANELVYYHAMMNRVVSEDPQDKLHSSISNDTEEDKNSKSQQQMQDLQDEKSKLYFVDTLITRLYEHPFVPRVLVSTAGTATSVYFTSHFGTENTNSQYLISYEDFRSFILDVLITGSSNSQK